MLADHVFVDTQGANHFCAHCGAAEPMKTPAPITEMIQAMEQFGSTHRTCPKPMVLFSPPRPDRPLPAHLPEAAFSAWPGLTGWLQHGEIGMSSLTLASAITGLPLVDYASAPADASDFRRCVGLLQAVPSMRDQLMGVQGQLDEEWLGILGHWTVLEAMALEGDVRWRELTERIHQLRGD